MSDKRNTKEMNYYQLSRTLVIVFSCLLVVLLILHFVIPKSGNPSAGKDEGTDELTEDTSVEEETVQPLPDSLTDLNSITVLIDKNHTLPSDYVPSDLVQPYIVTNSDVIYLRQEAADATKEMIAAAAEDDITLIIVDGYISYDTEQEQYASLVNLVGAAEADYQGMKPGSNEHQSGLSIDISSDANSVTPVLNDSVQAWIREHAAEYGFIERYPEGKESITGVKANPYHYRYVGKDTAQAIASQSLTFEEYFNVQK